MAMRTVLAAITTIKFYRVNVIYPKSSSMTGIYPKSLKMRDGHGGTAATERIRRNIVNYVTVVSEGGQQPQIFKDDGYKLKPAKFAGNILHFVG
jgi:hypothetical protein